MAEPRAASRVGPSPSFPSDLLDYSGALREPGGRDQREP
ncbi:hypothetical protein X805_39160 [Sphaerotilus natans subsp. natans DSM 6575]|uniref:Uncharacterized protein n=1 Tax=Sphaerotilus natans subsp. natans DSM 6575 TaxID=1286631 RepID=A0A059KH26_9BURK|nr:hypothetical protein X805_39160 [Sphaerotilus natans subsp. natans DSM 6575]